jgi:hypothetical protein
MFVRDSDCTDKRKGKVEEKVTVFAHGKNLQFRE